MNTEYSNIKSPINVFIYTSILIIILLQFYYQKISFTSYKLETFKESQEILERIIYLLYSFLIIVSIHYIVIIDVNKVINNSVFDLTLNLDTILNIVKKNAKLTDKYEEHGKLFNHYLEQLKSTDRLDKKYTDILNDLPLDNYADNINAIKKEIKELGYSERMNDYETNQLIENRSYLNTLLKLDLSNKINNMNLRDYLLFLYNSKDINGLLKIYSEKLKGVLSHNNYEILNEYINLNSKINNKKSAISVYDIFDETFIKLHNIAIEIYYPYLSNNNYNLKKYIIDDNSLQTYYENSTEELKKSIKEVIQIYNSPEIDERDEYLNSLLKKLNLPFKDRVKYNNLENFLKNTEYNNDENNIIQLKSNKDNILDNISALNREDEGVYNEKIVKIKKLYESLENLNYTEIDDIFDKYKKENNIDIEKIFGLNLDYNIICNLFIIIIYLINNLFENNFNKQNKLPLLILYILLIANIYNNDIVSQILKSSGKNLLILLCIIKLFLQFYFNLNEDKIDINNELIISKLGKAIKDYIIFNKSSHEGTIIKKRSGLLKIIKCILSINDIIILLIVGYVFYKYSMLYIMPSVSNNSIKIYNIKEKKLNDILNIKTIKYSDNSLVDIVPIDKDLVIYNSGILYNTESNNMKIGIDIIYKTLLTIILIFLVYENIYKMENINIDINIVIIICIILLLFRINYSSILYNSVKIIFNSFFKTSLNNVKNIIIERAFLSMVIIFSIFFIILMLVALSDINTTIEFMKTISFANSSIDNSNFIEKYTKTLYVVSILGLMHILPIIVLSGYSLINIDLIRENDDGLLKITNDFNRLFTGGKIMKSKINVRYIVYVIILICIGIFIYKKNKKFIKDKVKNIKEKVINIKEKVINIKEKVKKRIIGGKTEENKTDVTEIPILKQVDFVNITLILLGIMIVIKNNGIYKLELEKIKNIIEDEQYMAVFSALIPIIFSIIFLFIYLGTFTNENISNCYLDIFLLDIDTKCNKNILGNYIVIIATSLLFYIFGLIYFLYDYNETNISKFFIVYVIIGFLLLLIFNFIKVFKTQLGSILEGKKEKQTGGIDKPEKNWKVYNPVNSHIMEYDDDVATLKSKENIKEYLVGKIDQLFNSIELPVHRSNNLDMNLNMIDFSGDSSGNIIDETKLYDDEYQDLELYNDNNEYQDTVIDIPRHIIRRKANIVIENENKYDGIYVNNDAPILDDYVSKIIVKAYLTDVIIIELDKNYVVKTIDVFKIKEEEKKFSIETYNVNTKIYNFEMDNNKITKLEDNNNETYIRLDIIAETIDLSKIKNMISSSDDALKIYEIINNIIRDTGINNYHLITVHELTDDIIQYVNSAYKKDNKSKIFKNLYLQLIMKKIEVIQNEIKENYELCDKINIEIETLKRTIDSHENYYNNYSKLTNSSIQNINSYSSSIEVTLSKSIGNAIKFKEKAIINATRSVNHQNHATDSSYSPHTHQPETSELNATITPGFFDRNYDPLYEELNLLVSYTFTNDNLGEHQHIIRKGIYDTSTNIVSKGNCNIDKIKSTSYDKCTTNNFQTPLPFTILKAIKSTDDFIIGYKKSGQDHYLIFDIEKKRSEYMSLIKNILDMHYEEIHTGKLEFQIQNTSGTSGPTDIHVHTKGVLTNEILIYGNQGKVEIDTMPERNQDIKIECRNLKEIIMLNDSNSVCIEDTTQCSFSFTNASIPLYDITMDI